MLTRRRVIPLVLASAVLPRSAASANNLSYEALLGRYVIRSADGINRVDYRRWSGNKLDRGALADFIQQQEAVNVSALGSSEKFTFWANLYNAITLNVVLGHYPVTTIKDIKSDGAWLNPKAYTGPWVQKRVTVEGQALSLDDIEHGILRAKFKEPRVHYAVNCASLGCPNLRGQPWRAETLVGDLDQAASEFVNHPRAAHFSDDGGLVVSSLYRWFSEDFGNSDAAIISHLKMYARPDLKQKLVRITSVGGDTYDWSINET